MSDDVSDRVIDQRLRNRMSEVVLMLAEWQDTLATIGEGEYFNAFFDWFPDSPPLPPNSALTDGERDALTAVLILMDDAARSTPKNMNGEQLVASEWPQRIGPVAQFAYELIQSRGLFSEDREEAAPSDAAPI